MTRYIDADALKNSIDEHVYLVHHGFNETEYGCTQYGIHQIIDDAPTIDAVPIEWILNNERMPKEGKGRKAIMDMLEDWRKEHDTMNGIVTGELIRCKDCLHAKKSVFKEKYKRCDYNGEIKSPQDYCSWAERRNPDV